jgi:hypothetical protein
MLKWILGFPYAVWFTWHAKKMVWEFYAGMPYYTWGSLNLDDLSSTCGGKLTKQDLQNVW